MNGCHAQWLASTRQHPQNGVGNHAYPELTMISA
jgi:hypothetical protein